MNQPYSQTKPKKPAKPFNPADKRNAAMNKIVAKRERKAKKGY